MVNCEVVAESGGGRKERAAMSAEGEDAEGQSAPGAPPLTDSDRGAPVTPHQESHQPGTKSERLLICETKWESYNTPSSKTNQRELARGGGFPERTEQRDAETRDSHLVRERALGH